MDKGKLTARCRWTYLFAPVIDEPVGLIECDDGTHLVRSCTREPGIIDCKGRSRRLAPPDPSYANRRNRSRTAAGVPGAICRTRFWLIRRVPSFQTRLFYEFRKQRFQNSIVTVGSCTRHGQVWCGQAGAAVGQFFQLERLFEYHAIIRMIAPAHFGI